MSAYADTSWWIAYKNVSDALHHQALQILDKPHEIIWTPWQRVEVFNAFRQQERAGLLPKNPAIVFIRSLEQEVRLGYWPHCEFKWIDAVRRANELSAIHSRDLLIRGMDLFHVAVAIESGCEDFVTFDTEQAALASAAGLRLWQWN